MQRRLELLVHALFTRQAGAILIQERGGSNNFNLERNDQMITGARAKTTMLIVTMIAITAASTRMRADSGTCGGAITTLPFTDVMSSFFFCEIAEAYFSGLTNGTTPTTYSPSANVTREQMAAFITRTLDQSLRRGSKRAALRQFWTTGGVDDLGLTTVGTRPMLLKSDGADLWIANYTSATAGASTISRVRASDGKLLQTWTGASSAVAVLVAMGKVFVLGDTEPGNLYQIDPTQAAGPVTLLTNTLGRFPTGIAYDGHRIWTANLGGSVSIITLNSMGPPTVINVSTGFSSLEGILFDGTNIWVTDNVSGSVDKLYKLDSNGAIIQSVDVGSLPHAPVFDGTNIWVPNGLSNSVSVVRAGGGLAGTVLATLTGNGLNGPIQVAFDGERILATSLAGDSISLWSASDLTPISTFSTGAGSGPHGVCSNGTNFWITLETVNKLARL
jgi:hypothetical protein